MAKWKATAQDRETGSKDRIEARSATSLKRKISDHAMGSVETYGGDRQDYEDAHTLPNESKPLHKLPLREVVKTLNDDPDISTHTYAFRRDK